MIVYLDTSATYKLLRKEAESQPLSEWLTSNKEAGLVASDLMRVELMGNLAARHPDLLPTAIELIKRVSLIAISTNYLDAAISLIARGLGTLDAIHLATALSAGQRLEALITYDKRLASVATQLGVKVLSPGGIQ